MPFLAICALHRINTACQINHINEALGLRIIFVDRYKIRYDFTGAWIPVIMTTDGKLIGVLKPNSLIYRLWLSGCDCPR